MNDFPSQEQIEKYLNGTATETELADLHRWYVEKSQAGAVWQNELPGEYETVQNRVFNKVTTQISHVQKVKHPFFSSVTLRIAAALMLFALASVTYYFIHNNSVGSIVVNVSQKSLNSRYVILPDSSIVILRAGSEVKYAYSKNLRTVYLSGEAYFDVKHRQKWPFVVFSGTCKTTVLGTAFNIKAFPGQVVTVTVARGKVSVENLKKKSLTVLVPNQQVSLQNEGSTGIAMQAEANEATDWTRQDMQFEKITFKDLAARLGKRYNKNIEFLNPKLEKCLITGRFTGTETIEEVLTVISETMGTSYKINKDVIQINGLACI